MVEGQEIEPLSISSIYGSERQTKDVQNVDGRCIKLICIHFGSVENALTGYTRWYLNMDILVL